MTELALSCRSLVKHYGDLVAVAGLDLEVTRGECFGLLGPNGAGKTTTLEILEGLLEPTSGDIQVLGKRWSTDENWLRQRIAISLQETHLTDKLSVLETLTLFRSFYSTGRDVLTTLDLVALGDKKNARYETLSGGQKQRLAVACALVSNPELLFLDEPTTGLDPQSRRMLWDVVTAFKREGGSVVLTTHYMDEAERLCDRVGVVDHGKMIALGTPRELIASLGATQIVELSTREPIEAAELRSITGVTSVRATGDGHALSVEQLHVTLPTILDHLEKTHHVLLGLSTHQATLEDVFVHLTGRQLRE